MRHKKNFSKMRPAIFIALVVLLVFSLIRPSDEKIFEVRINKQIVGHADSRKEITDMLGRIDEELMDRYFVEELAPYYEPAINKIVKGDLETTDFEDFRVQVLSSQKYITPGYELSVDSKVYAQSINMSDLEFVVECVKSRLRKEHENIQSIDFRESVEINPGNIFLRETLGQTGSDILVEHLLTGREKVETYTIKSGDTLTMIASSHGLDMDSILEANPEMDIDRIYAGQTIYLTKPSPLLHRK